MVVVHIFVTQSNYNELCWKEDSKESGEFKHQQPPRRLLNKVVGILTNRTARSLQAGCAVFNFIFHRCHSRIFFKHMWKVCWWGITQSIPYIFHGIHRPRQLFGLLYFLSIDIIYRAASDVLSKFMLESGLGKAGNFTEFIDGKGFLDIVLDIRHHPVHINW